MGDTRTVLVTGGAGYIGSHTCKALKAAGWNPVTFDNLVYGHEHAAQWGPLIKGELADQAALRAAFDAHQPEAVIHFAAYAYVGESVTEPHKYYDNNVVGTMSLLEVMREKEVANIVFSSTCATYGVPEALPITEETPQDPINPYGRTKLMIEQILKDFDHAYATRSVSLRYFNASGADEDGEIGEEHDPETHLIPRALMALTGEIPALEIYGDDYPTPDGTCLRDYIHVTDLAAGHIAALDYLLKGGSTTQINLGAGRGISVKEILEAIEREAGRPVPATFTGRRPGDPPALFADISRAREVLGFEPQHSDVDTIIRTAWAFHQAARARRSAA